MKTIVKAILLIIAAISVPSPTYSAICVSPLDEIKFYGYFEGADQVVFYIDNKKVQVAPGEIVRHEFNAFDEIEGVITDVMDVETTISNKESSLLGNLKVTLVIYPKVANLFYKNLRDVPGLLDYEAIEKSAMWLKPIIVKSNTLARLPGGSTKHVVFEKINLKKIIDNYTAKKRWPIELKIKIISDIGSGENKAKHTGCVVTRHLKIPLPAY